MKEEIYSEDHIDAVVERINEYADYLNKGGYANDCKICDRRCKMCLIYEVNKKKGCLSNFRAMHKASSPLLARRCVQFGESEYVNHAIAWRKEMLRRARENLKRANSKWTIEEV